MYAVVERPDAEESCEDEVSVALRKNVDWTLVEPET